MSANALVRGGTPVHVKGGELSLPVQVYCEGITELSLNAVLWSFMADSLAKRRLGMHRVTDKNSAYLTRICVTSSLNKLKRCYSQSIGSLGAGKIAMIRVDVPNDMLKELLITAGLPLDQRSHFSVRLM